MKAISRTYFLISLFVLTLIILLISCRKAEVETATNFLGHKGSGNNNYNDVVIENTLPSVQNALKKLDGTELDIQMSLDNTVWLWHNADLSGYICDDRTRHDTIPKMRDAEIEKIRICHGNKSDRMYRLSEVIDWSNSTANGIHISLDVKVSFKPNTFLLYGNRDGYLQRLAASLAKIFESYKFANKTLIEVDSRFFCQQLKSYNSTKDLITCFMRSEPMPQKIENAVRLGYNGLSCNYTDATVTKETIAAAHNAGLIVQVWTPYYRDELRKAFAMNPDFIQTDNVYAKEALNVR